VAAASPARSEGITMSIQVSSPADNVVALADAAAIPGLGFLPVNAYLLRAEEPLLVDTGLPASRPDFLQALWTQIEPADLRWIYLTHPAGTTPEASSTFWMRHRRRG
jgi:flavorubredoxin